MIKVKPGDDIQAALDCGEDIIFEPGFYEGAEYRITKPAKLSGYGAVLVGGRKIEWTDEGNGVLSAEIDNKEPLQALFVGGKPRMRCRYPEEGFMEYLTDCRIEQVSAAEGSYKTEPTHDDLTLFQIKTGDLDGLTLHSAEVQLMHCWDDSHCLIESVEGDMVRLASETIQAIGSFGNHKYCLWNIPEAFTKKGTYYHDLKAHKLYYRPLDGENAGTESYLPISENIFRIEEDISGLTIEGFEIIVSACPAGTAGFGGTNKPGAIEFRGKMRNCVLRDLKLHSLGGLGIKMCDGTSGGTIENCDIYEMGGGGIKGGGISGEDLTVINNNRIHDLGYYYPQGFGINGPRMRVTNNVLYNTGYSAIACGGNGAHIEGNVIHDCMRTFSDGAAIYVCGQNSVMRKNFVYNIHSEDGKYNGIAYYIDEYGSGWLVEDNVVINGGRPNHNHMNTKNIYRHNLFANTTGKTEYTWQRSHNETYENNVFWSKGETWFYFPEDGFEVFKNNRYYSCDGEIHWGVYVDYTVTDRKLFEPDETNVRLEETDLASVLEEFGVGDISNLDIAVAGL